ncbi:hypothetical protein FE782_12615 [Paenibacillus antri]|uniref:Uncharacterized protein n=1 Tax=Paenibacillus antri TaxID=2582848 RepID=A0A5R9GGB3_9BACL|nr:hypothetical protein [Paenibacillus antri]TLS51753.1 hypothetical protein FE782_12615 [Paenibacillus antri]
MTSLIRYLPEYYRESRQMNAILDAAAPDIPDVEGRLLHALFLSEAPEEWLGLWKRELQAPDRDALLAKLRSSGTLILDTILALGLTATETYRLSPEDGYTLSGDDAVFPDGAFYGPLISAIHVEPEQVEVVRKLIQISGFAGFRYWLAVHAKASVRTQAPKAGMQRSVYPGIDRETKLSYGELSGRGVDTAGRVALVRSHEADAGREAWWSPGLFFTDPLRFTDETVRAQQCAVTVVQEPM